MKSIKEKAEEYRRVIKVIDEHESIVDTQGSEMFEAGANYVLEQIENILYRRYSDDGDPHQRWIDMDKVFKELKG